MVRLWMKGDDRAINFKLSMLYIYHLRRCRTICGIICMALMMGTLIILSLISHSEHVIAFIEFPSGDTIAREASHPTMSQFTNSSNFTVLLGFSPNKCGSSKFIRDFRMTLRGLENPENVTKRSVFKLVRPLSGADELKYWSLCVIPSWIARAHNKYIQPYYPGKWSLETRGCSMESYLHKFASNLSTLHSMTKERHVYLMEKDTQYIRYYHSIMTLSIYARSFPLYFYISLRNPSTRLWSHYWHLLHHVYNSSDPQSVQQLMDQIEYEMDVFPEEHPKYQQVFDALSLQYGDHIDGQEVVRLWKDAMYDLSSNLYAERPHSLRGVQHWGDFAAKAVSPVGMPVFAVSCYYPQILTLYHALEGRTDRVRIFQMEWWHRGYSTRDMVRDILLWLQEVQGHDPGAMQDIKEYFDRHQQEYFDKFGTGYAFSSYIPHNIPFAESPLYGKLNAFFRDCNYRLYSFLMEHPRLLLTNSETHQTLDFIF